MSLATTTGSDSAGGRMSRLGEQRVVEALERVLTVEESRDALPWGGEGGQKRTAVSFPPPPPCLRSCFGPLLDNLHEEVVALDSALRLHVSLAATSTSCRGGNGSSGQLPGSCLLAEADASLDDLLAQLLDTPDDAAAESRGGASAEAWIECADGGGGGVRRDAQDDALEALLDDLLDGGRVVEEWRQHIREDRPPTVPDPMLSCAGVSMEDFISAVSEDAAISVRSSSSVSTTGVGGGFGVTSDGSGMRVPARDTLACMHGCVDSLLHLRDAVATHVRGMQQELDARYARCCDYIRGADLTARQSRLNMVIKLLCSHTDRCNTTRALRRWERRRLQAILRAGAGGARGCAAAAAHSSCICRAASPLRGSYLLAQEVLSLRRQHHRLVFLFSACPEAVEQWAVLLQEEANTVCRAALEAIFHESVLEKEKLWRAFEIMVAEDL